MNDHNSSPLEKNVPGFGRATFLFGHEGRMDATVVAAAKQGFGYTLASIGVFVALLLFLLAMFKAEWIGLS
jgi:hypothetical protein